MDHCQLFFHVALSDFHVKLPSKPCNVLEVLIIYVHMHVFPPRAWPVIIKVWSIWPASTSVLDLRSWL